MTEQLHTEFSRFVESWGLQHFEPHEFLVHVGDVRKGHQCKFPPKGLWKNLKSVALIVDELRKRLGKPITITSAYRSEGYNKAIGGVSSSQHKQFKALDIKAKGLSPRRIHAELLKMRNEGKFKGGLGLYGGFVHVDTRGRNSSWRG